MFANMRNLLMPSSIMGSNTQEVTS